MDGHNVVIKDAKPEEARVEDERWLRLKNVEVKVARLFAEKR